MDLRILLRVAWLSVLLGVGMQVVLLLLQAGSGSWRAPWIADSLSFVSWSIAACTGLAVGMALARLRMAAVALAGALAAPAAFAIARVVHVGVSSALDSTTSGGLPPLPLALVKAVEYAVLALGLSYAVRRWPERSGRVLLVGAAVGLLFGGAIVAWTAAALAPPPPALVGRAFNEIVFPMGCALVIVTARALRQPEESVELAAAA